MSLIKQIILARRNGKGKRQTARDLGIDKKTVKKYLNRIDADPAGEDALLALSDPELERRMCGGNAAYSDRRFDLLSGELDYLVKELGRTGVTLQTLWEEFRGRHGGDNSYGYTQFCFHVRQHMAAVRPKMVLTGTYKEGLYLYVDFAGQKMHYVDRDTGELVEVEVYVSTMPASDYGFAIAVPSQRVEDFIWALERDLRSKGCVPGIIRTDNLKSAVTRADRYSPDINRTLLDFCNHYGIELDPARAAKPTDKALVEDHVKLVYRRVFAPLRDRQFFSLEELNAAIAECMRRHNQKHFQRKPFTREELWLAREKPAMAPIRAEPFEIITRMRLKLQQNSHVYVTADNHYYSAPYKYIGRELDVLHTRSLVRIFADGQEVACHVRCDHTLNLYSKHDWHLPSYHNDYQQRSPDYYVSRAMAVSEPFGRLMRGVFARCNYPETMYKSCDGLLSMQKKADPEVFNRAVAIALEVDNCRYPFVKSLVETRCRGYEELEQPTIFPGRHPNIRGKAAYS
ncbi:MAG: IS21 family transposase [Bacteroidales bacterium]|nr:IS21 family transposase [Bacteroidales bacterium]